MSVLAGDRKRVLVVEDDPKVLFLWSAALKKLPNIVIETADGGEQALARFDVGAFDLVVTDLSMPGMNGVDLTRHIHQRAKDVPIVWVTAHAAYEERLAEPGIDVRALLVKPISIHQIRETVCHVLGLESPALGPVVHNQEDGAPRAVRVP